MSTIYVQFSDATETKIISIFGSGQDPTVYANLGILAASDARYAAFYDLFDAQFQASMPNPESSS